MKKMLLLAIAAIALIALGALPAAAQVSGSGGGFQGEEPPDEIAPDDGVIGEGDAGDDVTAAGDAGDSAPVSGLAATGLPVTAGMLLVAALVVAGGLALMLARRRPASQS